jgi:pimeloyl-ACP methyl ester carboxylesterase
LREILVPTLLLVGDADIPDVHAHAGAIEAGIPNARRVVVEGVGHIMYLEKPSEFSHLVISFIEQNGRVSPANSLIELLPRYRN